MARYRAASVAVVLAVDAGTTGIRAVAVDEEGIVRTAAYRELAQHFPAPGLVEHDAEEIFGHVESVLAEVCGRFGEKGESVAALGITNQRETAVAWDMASGRALCPCICWQDRRTAARCGELAAAGHLPEVRRRTGLVLDSYFSATKWEWMLRRGGVPASPRLALGTVDDWLVYRLTGGPDGGVHATDVSNASRTLCFDIGELAWSEELCELFGIPRSALGEVRPSCGRFGLVHGGVAGGALRG
ncbi:MAG: FGGY family carbohydrate kinase, partial [Acidimicrobiales bacterium]